MAEKTFDGVFRTRGVTSLFYVLAWMATLFISPWVFIIVMGLVYLISFREYEQMILIPEQMPSQFRGFPIHIFIGLLGIESLTRYERVSPVLFLVVFSFLLIGLILLFQKKWSDGWISAKNYQLFYPGTGILAALWIVFPDGWGNFQPLPLLALLVLIWSNDSYAYIAGKTWGKHPLWASVSPKKTWEGTAGGALGTFLTAWLWTLIVPGSDLILLMVAALTVSILGPMGDLFESKAKRKAGIKDSGHWLPGHGGLLDRLDSFLWVTPAYWLITSIFFT